MALIDIIMAILFVGSSGILFHEKFRNNKVLIVISGGIALVSTYLLFDQLHWLPRYAPGQAQTAVTAAPEMTRNQPATGVAANEPAPQPAQQAADPVAESEARSVFDSYLGAWQSGDVSKQAALLADEFHYVDQSKWQSRSDYLAQKQRLARNYLSRGSITITPEDVQVKITATGATVSYIQHYRSAGYWSDGTNVFTMRKINGSVKITEERFNKTASGEPS
jgi:hypothetical protein